MDWQVISAFVGIIGVIIAYVAWRKPVIQKPFHHQKDLVSKRITEVSDQLNPLYLLSLLDGMITDSSKVRTCIEHAPLIQSISLSNLTKLINTVVTDSSKVEITKSFKGKIRKNYSPKEAKEFSDQFVTDSSKVEANEYLT